MTMLGRTTSTTDLNGQTTPVGSTSLLKIETVAEQCGVSIRTVQRWIERDDLTVHRLPGTGLRPILRIAEADLEMWLDRHRHDPEVEGAGGQQTIRLDGIRFIKTASPESSKPELDTSRRFRPRVERKD